MQNYFAIPVFLEVSGDYSFAFTHALFDAQFKLVKVISFHLCHVVCSYKVYGEVNLKSCKTHSENQSLDQNSCALTIVSTGIGIAKATIIYAFFLVYVCVMGILKIR